MSFTQMAINHQAKFSPAQHNNELKGFYHIKFSIAQTSYFGKYWGVVKLVLVGRAKKNLKVKILFSMFVPWDLEATRT